MSLKNNQRDLVAQCQLLWFPWIIEEDLDSADQKDLTALSESDSFDISNHLIQSCTFSKNRGSASGSFNFKLDNSKDWKEIMRPGQWCLIFMSNEGDLSLPKTESLESLSSFDKSNIKKDKLRGICYIERVAVTTSIQENGVLDVYYEVSGRDFGVCYEETSIWYNYFKFEKTKIVDLSTILEVTTNNTIDQLISKTHDLFFAPHLVIPGVQEGDQAVAETPLQWLLPRSMLNCIDVNLTNDTEHSFFGNIDGLKNFQTTISTIAITDPLSYINGGVWEKLKEFSVKELHELYAELDDTGKPNLIFRPIPWGIDPKGYPKLAGDLVDTVLSYAKLIGSAGVSLNSMDLINASLGEDNHSRYNHFFTTSSITFGQPESNISNLKDIVSPAGKTFPYLNQNSIRRHGFRPMHCNVDTLGQFSGDLKIPKTKIVEVNELIYDYWNNAIFFESGTLSIIGNNQIRVGKVLNLDKDVPYHGNKSFYIEEYVDEFSIDDNGVTSWNQSITVSRGIDKKALTDLVGFFTKQTKFKDLSDFIKD